MSGFTNLHIKGYRRLFDVNVELRPLTVMIGANGAGKTSLLEVIGLLSQAANGKIQDAISERGGITEILTRDRAKSLGFEMEMSQSRGESLNYKLVLAPKGIGHTIVTESLTQHDNDGVSWNSMELRDGKTLWSDYPLDEPCEMNTPYNPMETSLARIDDWLTEAAEEFRRSLASCMFYSALDVGPRSPVRLPQTMRPAVTPGANGEYLVSYLYYMRETDPDRFEVIEDTMRAAFPDLEKLSFPPVAAGTLAMTWKDRNFTVPVYMHELSEGSIRFLWLTALLLSGSLPAITLLEEPEVSLHPELMPLLIDLMRNASNRTQLIVATHSDRLVRYLEPKELLVCEMNDGAATMTWASEMDIESWMKDFALNELWEMKRLRRPD